MLRIRPGTRVPRVSRVMRVSLVMDDEALLIMDHSLICHRTSDHVCADGKVTRQGAWHINEHWMTIPQGNFNASDRTKEGAILHNSVLTVATSRCVRK